jgi:PhoPQ-activated pathogenicity-related protein
MIFHARPPRRAIASFFLRALVAFAFLQAAFFSVAGPLEDYVSKKDGAFAWNSISTNSGGGFAVVRLSLRSQHWRETDWNHDLVVVVPENLRHAQIALLMIGGDGDGANRVSLLKKIAGESGTMAAILTRVPNQPLYSGKMEDALIAYTFDQYARTGESDWPVLFPMVKSAISAMDALQEWANGKRPGPLNKFVVTGASKRGWTTWLTGATDPRVAGIAPMVIDMLNMKKQIAWQRRAYGKTSEQIHDYAEAGLLDRLDDPAMSKLIDLVDPYAYRDRYSMPKLILLGANDRYWTVDSLRLYWNDLPGQKLIFQTPNAGHNLNGGAEATDSLGAWFALIAEAKPLPEMKWKFERKGEGMDFDVTLSQPASEYSLWIADSTDRDFRDDTWRREKIEGSDARHVQGTVPPSKSAFRAFLIEAQISGKGLPFRLSTEARVIPDWE